MSKIKDTIKYNTPSLESEHYGNFHDTYQEGCQQCWAENRLIKAKVTCMCHKCIGCGSLNATKCDNTLCYNCWSRENE